MNGLARLGALLVTAVVLVGCRVGEPAPVPLAGDEPQVVAVWPFVLAEQPVDAELLLGSLGGAMTARGYRTISYAVGLQMLRDANMADAAEVTRAGAVLGADAVLQVLVREFEASGSRPLREARWDLQWRLLSTRGGCVLWSFAQRGAMRANLGDGGDPHRALDAERDIVPMGGGAPVTYRDADELVASLHRLALSRLPRRSP